jgi:hypothetical protein
MVKNAMMSPTVFNPLYKKKRFRKIRTSNKKSALQNPNPHFRIQIRTSKNPHLAIRT